MGSIYSRFSEIEKKIFYATLGNAGICMAILGLIQEGTIRANHDIQMIILGIGTAPILILILIAKYVPSKKVKRRAFSNETKERVLRRQNHQCNDCGNYTKNWDFDHVESRGDNSAENCQALCLNCHRDKTRREARQSKK